MEFRIADTFTDSLARLTGDEQRAVKTTAFDLQIDPSSPGMNFHKLEKARDKNFWSVRVNSDLRLIVHRTSDSLLLCYVAHHDKAYDWAERRKLETHPRTGAAQLIEVRESVREVVVQQYVTAPQAMQTGAVLFSGISDDQLLGYGVPTEWLPEVRGANENSLLIIAAHLPGEAAEALLELATGGKPRVPLATLKMTAPFQHPDAQRRFRLVSSTEELERALDYPWDRWTIFLHPEQRQWVERDYNGPARISGSAGTGKTIVALHRAAFLARKHPTRACWSARSPGSWPTIWIAASSASSTMSHGWLNVWKSTRWMIWPCASIDCTTRRLRSRQPLSLRSCLPGRWN